MTSTHTRTHVFVSFANPYLICSQCRGPVIGWHDSARCGCDGPAWLTPCGHQADTFNPCPSWSPVDGCTCGEEEGER